MLSVSSSVSCGGGRPLGGDVGRRNFNYLLNDPSNRDRLVEHDEAKVPWGVGFTTAWVPNFDHRFVPTIEGLFSYRSRWTGSERTVEWCSPAGEVLRDNTTGQSDPAESCRKAALGAPVPAELAGLPPQAQQGVMAQLREIRSSEVAADLEQFLAMIAERKGAAPPEMAPVMELLERTARERLEQLRAAEKGGES